MNIWKVDSEIKEYETLHLTNEKGDFERYFDLLYYSVTPMEVEWEKVKIYTLDGSRKSDCPQFWGGAGVLVLSEKAVKILYSMLEKHAEILPLDHPVDSYYLIHVVNGLKALDYNKSRLKRMNSGLIVGIDKYDFVSDVVRKQDIFKIYLNEKIYPTGIYVSDQFRDTVLKNNLQGFNFIKVWSSD